MQIWVKLVEATLLSTALAEFPLSKSRIVLSNPSQDMDICPCLFVYSCFPVWVGSLQRADLPSKDFYHLPVRFIA
jgi:hypothetical protein